jgi:hypothetical protein
LLPKSVICPRSRKRGFLTLRWVRSSRDWKGEAPNPISHWIDEPLLNPLAANGQREPTTTKRKRNLLRYTPTWHLYIGHYDSEKYSEAMERYKKGRLKSRPNGRSWHKVRYSAVEEEAQSDLDILMSKYDFDLRDLRNEERERKEDFLLKRGIL